MKHLVLINQSTGYLTIDTINAYASKYDEVALVVVYGSQSVVQQLCSSCVAVVIWKDMSWDSAVSERIIAGWSATVPAGKTVKFVTTLKKQCEMKRLVSIAVLAVFMILYYGCAEPEHLDPDNTEQDGSTDEGQEGEDNTGQDGGQDNTGIPEGFEDEPDDPTADPNLTFNYSLVKKAGHPRLLCDAQGFADLKTRE